MKERGQCFRRLEWLLAFLLLIGTMAVCISLGSVTIGFGETLGVLWRALWGLPQNGGTAANILLSIRLPRVLCVALTGAALSLCGGAMQGLLRNPLADGSTMGVSSGAALGAVTAILLGFSLPELPFAGTMLLAILFAFLSLCLILSMAYVLDRSLSTSSMILIGVIFTMFANSIMSLLIAFSGDKLRSITFWTMGSLSGSSYANVLTLLGALVLGGGVLLSLSRELNAFAIGEENALHLGVNVKGVKLTVLIVISVLMGVCVSIGGTIGFVGLVVPHMARMLVGPNHRRLLPASLFGGAIFLMLCDLCGRMILRPIELPIGVITSLIGSVVFVLVFYRTRRGKGSSGRAAG